MQSPSFSGWLHHESRVTWVRQFLFQKPSPAGAAEEVAVWSTAVRQEAVADLDFGDVTMIKMEGQYTTVDVRAYPGRQNIP